MTTLEINSVDSEHIAPPAIAPSLSTRDFYKPKGAEADWAMYSKEYAKKFRGKTLHRGFLNAGFINGYVNRIEGRTLWMQLSNLVDSCLPILLPASLLEKRAIRPHHPITAQYSIRGCPSPLQGAGFITVASLRAYGSIETAALPLRAAFFKTSANTNADGTMKGDKDFKPYGSGIRLQGDPNRCFIAGIISAKRSVRITAIDPEDGSEYTKSPYSEVLIRQDDDPNNRIPVRIYRANHERLVADVKIGDPVYIEAKMMIAHNDVLDAEGNAVLLPDGGTRRLASTFLQTDALRMANDSHIIYLPDEDRLPEWAQELRQRGDARRRVVAVPTAANVSAHADAGDDADTDTTVPVGEWLHWSAEDQYATIDKVRSADGVTLLTAQEAMAFLPPARIAAIHALHEEA